MPEVLPTAQAVSLVGKSEKDCPAQALEEDEDEAAAAEDVRAVDGELIVIVW